MKIFTRIFLRVAVLALLTACTPKVRFAPGQIPTAPATTQEDIRLGLSVMQHGFKDHKILTDPKYVKRLDLILSRMFPNVPSSDLWRTYIVDDDTDNAMTAPGKFIFVFKGIMDSTESDDELAGILAHEIGHRLAAHEIPTEEENIAKALTGIVVLATGIATARQPYATNQKVAENMAGMQESLAPVTFYPYSQVKEKEADLIGIFLMADSGFNPAHFARYWQKRSTRPEARQHERFSYRTTHPPDSERYAAAMMQMQMAETRYKAALARIAEEDKKPKSQKKKTSPYVPSAVQMAALSQALTKSEQYDFETARNISKELTDSSPRFEEAWTTYGLSLYRMGKITEARNIFEKSLKHLPESSNLIYNSGCMNALLGNSGPALNQVKKALSLDPSLANLAKDDPDLSSLRDNQQFKDLLVLSPSNSGGTGKATYSINSST